MIYGLRFTLLLIFTCSAFFLNAGTPADKDSTAEKKLKLPAVSIGPGLLYFLGDVGYSHFNEPFLSKSGFQLEVQKHTNSNLALSFVLLGGKVFGEEKTSQRQVNFTSSIFAEGLQLRYDFQSRKRTDQVLIPYISIGAEYMSFSPKGDLKDANGTAYNYWSDGSIRSLPQNDPNASQAKLINRDYNYETDLRDANIDSLGKFRSSTIAFPVGIGVKFRLSGRCSMNFGTAVHFTSSDLIDAVNNESKGTRQGNDKNDKIIFSFVAFRYDFSAPREVPKKEKLQNKGDFKNVDFNALSVEDTDHDGIPDIKDDVIDSTKNIKVDANGRPVDSDGDGIPDYKDLELNSAKGALVNEEGETITDEMMEAKWKKDSLAALPAIVVYLHHKSKETGTGEGKTIVTDAPITETPSSAKKIPAKFQSLDKDHNGVIAPTEVVNEIDKFLDSKSALNTKEFYELIDFFFSQE